ncbi:hypothetical protein HHE02_11310 [Helicobacter heilmannii]|nr:hypothetical protein HHE02_11310 [Helicobacter heilmannii]
MDALANLFLRSMLRDKRGEKPNYFSFLTNTDNTACLEAILRVCPKINMDTIQDIVNKTSYTTSYTTHLHQEFLSKVLEARKTNILDKAYTHALQILLEKDETTITTKGHHK